MQNDIPDWCCVRTLTGAAICGELKGMARFRQDAAAEQVLRRDSEYLLPVYARFPVVMERGECPPLG